MGDERLGVALEALVGDRPDVVAGRERLAGAGDEDAADVDAVVELRQRRGDRVEDGVGERVALPGVVQRQPRDRIGGEVEQQLAARQLPRLTAREPDLRRLAAHRPGSVWEADWPGGQLPPAPDTESGNVLVPATVFSSKRGESSGAHRHARSPQHPATASRAVESGRTVEVHNPATGELIGTVPAMQPRRGDRGRRPRPRGAARLGRPLGFAERGRILRRAQKWTLDNAERIIAHDRRRERQDLRGRPARRGLLRRRRRSASGPRTPPSSSPTRRSTRRRRSSSAASSWSATRRSAWSA